jgi:hypothetical protein
MIPWWAPLRSRDTIDTMREQKYNTKIIEILIMNHDIIKRQQMSINNASIINVIHF